MKTPGTVRLRRLIRELRRLRDKSGLSTVEAATRLNWSRSRVNRLEIGDTPPTPEDVAQLCDLYGVTEPERTALIQLAEDSGRRGWWTSYRDVFTGSYVSLEDEASTISEWTVQLVPGLLQTDEYARATIEANNWMDNPADHIQRRLMARMARKTLLSRPGAPAFHAVIDESVLQRPIGGQEVLNEQLRTLLVAGRRSNITIQVMPYEVGEHSGLEGSFIILGFDEQPDLDIAYVENTAGTVYVEDIDHVNRYKLVFDRICDAALSVERSRDLIAAHIKE